MLQDPSKDQGRASLALARLSAALYLAWGVFHIYVAADIFRLGQGAGGIAQGRLFQLAAYMLSIALFAIVVAVWRNWRNDRFGYWANLLVVGWADLIWVGVVVLPGYVPLTRGLAPPAIYVAAAVLGTMARRS
jgi:hypothetical protein